MANASRYVFLFDLDSTITRHEILPMIAKEFGVYEQMRALTDRTLRGELPFKQSFLQRVELLKGIPVRKVREFTGKMELNGHLVEFIKRYQSRCYIVTGNLDVWVEDLLKRLGMEKSSFCSKAFVEKDHIQAVSSVMDKSAVISQMVLPFVAVGDGNNDAEMIEAAEIGIGYGGVREIAPSVLACASHAVYQEEKLVEFLERLA